MMPYKYLILLPKLWDNLLLAFKHSEDVARLIRLKAAKHISTQALGLAVRFVVIVVGVSINSFPIQ